MRRSAAPIEITIKASIGDEVAEVYWVFNRMHVMHRFTIWVIQSEDKSITIRDNKMLVSYPLSFTQRSEFKKRHPKLPLPSSHERKIDVGVTEYARMVASVVGLLTRRDLIEEARTAPGGMAVHRHEGFVYPEWYGKKNGALYDPRMERDPRSSIIYNPVPIPPPAGFPANPVLSADLATAALAIINQNLPPSVTGDPYEDGIKDYIVEITKVRNAINGQLSEQADKPKGPQMSVVLRGYLSLIDEVLSHGHTLLSQRSA